MYARLMPVGAAVLLLLAAGCGEGTYKVSGTVTFDGKPVEMGSIVFDAADGGPGVAAAGIRDGKYEMQSKTGQKKVTISAFRVRPGTENEPQPTMDEYIPKKYNVESDLIIEVMATENRFDFELKK